MSETKIVFYQKADGSKPIEEFLDSLDLKMRAKMLRSIGMLKENGRNLREPCSKPLQDGIFELRAQIGSNITRALYFFYIGNTAVLTNGFIKKTQKTPSKEIETAKKYRKDYLEKQEV